MPSTSRASRKREDAEIFQVLEESTDSDVTICSSEEDEDGNEPDSDEDGLLDDNFETNEDGRTSTSGPKTPHLKWTNTLNFKELEKYKIHQVLNILYQLAAVRKIFFELFVINGFYKKLEKKQINMQLYHKEKLGQWITTWKIKMQKKSKPILEF